MRHQNRDAVSPVVGVMLMLVVTIIIAAVVSAFSGGLGGSQQKTPQASITATFSQSDGMSITHNGGDPLGFKSTTLYLHNGKAWGSSVHMQYEINETMITDAYGNSVSIILPGDTVYISPPYNECGWLQPNYGSASMCYDNAVNVGKPIVLEISDTTGRLIAVSEFPITS